MQSQPKIVLASTSPQRIKILKQANIPFVTASPNYIEIDHSQLTPLQQAKQHALGKALSLADSYKNHAIIGCDTVIDCNGELLGKPKNREDAKRIITTLQSKTIKVISGLAVVNTQANTTYNPTVTTVLKLASMSKKEIELYLDSNEWEGKSGAFSIQGLGSRHIKIIRGDYYNVVGLPISHLYSMLKPILYNTP